MPRLVVAALYFLLVHSHGRSAGALASERVAVGVLFAVRSYGGADVGRVWLESGLRWRL